VLNPADILSVVLRGALGRSGRKRARRATKYITGNGGFLTASTVLAAAGARGVPCFSYTPQAVKLAVCGSGAAAKDQVQRMVGALLGLAEPPKSDHAADALALAICHAHQHR